MPEIGGVGYLTECAFVPKPTRSREVAFDVALAVARDGAYANLALPAALGGAGLSERDRAFVTELVYGSLRAQGELDAVIEEATRRAMSSLELEVTTLLRLGVYQVLRMRVETHAAVDESVRLAKTRDLHRVAGLVNAALRAVSAHPAEYWDRVIGQSTTSLHSHPSWIAAEIERALGECDGEGELEEALKAQNQAPLVTLCHLPGLSERPTQGATAFSPLGTILASGDPQKIPGIGDHSVRVQDEGSQLAALLLTRVTQLRAEERVWDMCAGPGGKTALLAAESGLVGATVLASEISAHRATLVEDSTSAVVARFPGSVQVEVSDSSVAREERFHRILLDAPCSGLGALRRRPEARWVKTPESIAALTTLQESLLRTGLDSLVPGGVLAYVTCSPVVDETTAVVDSVLGEDTRFLALDTPSVLESIVDSPVAGCRRGSAVQLWTHRHGTDAMFIQLIERVG